MNENLAKDIIKIILAAMVFVVIFLLMMYLTIAVGYGIGILLSVLPFVSGWLTNSLPITAEQIPHITSWISVIGMLGGTGLLSAKMSKEKQQ